MNSLEISLIALGCLMGGMLLGVWLQFRLPEHHLSPESQESVKLGAGMIATMSALVLGLLVSSAKSSFDAVNVSVAQNGASLIELDHLLAGYGPQAGELRKLLKATLARAIEKIETPPKNAPSGLRAIEKSTSILDFQSQLAKLTPTNDVQRSVLAQAQQIGKELWEGRLLIIEEQQEPLPPTFLVLLVFWLGLLFLSFGLYAPRNTTVFAVLFVCAVSVASAIFLILEMNHPLDGFIKVSDAPLHKALELMGQ